MCCKTITANLLIIVVLLVETSTYISKPTAYLEASLSIRQNHWTVTYITKVIYPSLSSFFYFRNILRSNMRSHQSIDKRWITIESYVGNSTGRCRSKNTTWKMNCKEIIKCLSFIDLIKWRYVLFRGPSITWKGVVESI